MQLGELLDALKDVPRDAQVQIHPCCHQTADGARLMHGAELATAVVLTDMPQRTVVSLDGPGITE